MVVLTTSSLCEATFLGPFSVQLKAVSGPTHDAHMSVFAFDKCRFVDPLQYLSHESD